MMDVQLKERTGGGGGGGGPGAGANTATVGAISGATGTDMASKL